MWFKELGGIGNTAENLLHAAEGENYEWTDMYDGFAKTADEEGFVLDDGTNQYNFKYDNIKKANLDPVLEF